MSDKKAWSGRTGGARWMQQCLISIFRYVHPVWVYPLMFFWVIGYIIGVPSTRKGIYDYWHRHRGCSCVCAAWHSFLSYYAFGQAILDRFAAWAGRRVQVKVVGQEVLDRWKGRGWMMISSHIGNQELAGYNISMPQAMDALIYMGDTDTVNNQRSRLLAQQGIRTIPYQKDGSHVLAMHQSLEEGHVLSVHGDRMLAATRPMYASIMGEEAAFPEGPFHIAVAERVPVVSMFMMREGKDNYTLYVRQLSDGRYTGATRKEQMQELLGEFVQVVEEIVDKYPHQWFHFYTFWA